MTEIGGFSSSNISQIQYANVSSPVKSQKIVVKDEIKAPKEMEVKNEDVQMEGLEEESSEDENPDDEDHMPDGKTKDLEIFNQAELNDVIRYLNLPKAGAELLASRLKNKNLLAKKYSEHQWPIFGDLKIATFLLSKYPCYLCLWDSRDTKNHYVKKEYPIRMKFNVGTHNVIRIPLIQPSKYRLPPLHIKLGLIKQCVKALNKNSDCFQCLKEKFLAISDAKLKEGIFNGPQIRTLFQDANFTGKMNDTEREAWANFKNVSKN
ncbi:hypothetical protein RN001_013277 [Aquatica leii]|uniref:Uncharacterized protein n=1 Tax=Aquatica leii TaxID=1421715 RepID=A0AAN7SCB8_9COLE|nr:hypothetical protein RN001_013277 [Aquatica leii]